MNLQMIIAGLGLVLVLGGGYLVTENIDGQFSFLDSGISCEYQVVDIEGQTFSSEAEFKSAVQANRGNWTEIRSTVAFRTRDGRLEYKLNEKTSGK